MIVLWDVRSGVGRPTLVFVEFVETADVDDGIFDATTTLSYMVNWLRCDSRTYLEGRLSNRSALIG